MRDHFFIMNDPKRDYDCEINDALDQLRAYEERYAGNGRPFLRDQGAKHFSDVPKLYRSVHPVSEPSAGVNL